MIRTRRFVLPLLASLGVAAPAARAQNGFPGQAFVLDTSRLTESGGLPEIRALEPGPNATCFQDNRYITGVNVTSNGSTASVTVTMTLPSGIPAGTPIHVTVDVRQNYCASGFRQESTSTNLSRTFTGLPANYFYFIAASADGCPDPLIGTAADSFTSPPTAPTIASAATGPNTATTSFTVSAPYGTAARLIRNNSALQSFYSPYCPIGSAQSITDSNLNPGTYTYQLQALGNFSNGFNPILSNQQTVAVGTGCPAPAVPTIMNVPSSIVAGDSFLCEWAGMSDVDYRIQVSSDQTFNSNFDLIVTRSKSILIPSGLNPPAGGKLYCRVRAERNCGGATSSSAYANLIAIDVVGRQPTLVATRFAPDLVVGRNGAAPSATVAFKNTGNSAATWTMNRSGNFFTTNPTSLTLQAGEEKNVTIQVTDVPVATAGFYSGQLWGTRTGGPTIEASIPVTLNVTPTNIPAGSRVGTRLRASSSKLYFSAAQSQTPGNQSVDISLEAATPGSPVPITLSVGPGGSWLNLPTTVPAVPPGQSVRLTFGVDRSRRSFGETRSPIRALIRIQAAGSGPDDVLNLEVLDVQPPTVDSGTSVRPGGTIPAGGSSFIVPTTVRAASATGADLTTDGWVRAEGTEDAALEMFFTPDGQDGVLGGGVMRARTTVTTKRTYRLADLLQSVFSVSGTGQVEIRTAKPTQLTVRATVESVSGGDASSRYGTEIPVAAYGQGIPAGNRYLALPGISDDGDNRTNLILSETSGSPIGVQVYVHDANGQQIGQPFSTTLGAYQKVQVNRLIQAVGGSQASNATAFVFGTGGFGTVVALATIIDNRSGSFSVVAGYDPIQAPAAPAVAKGEPSTNALPNALFVPSVARLTGANNTQFFTTLTLSNVTAQPANLILTYNYVDVAAGNVQKSTTKNLSLNSRGALSASVGRDVIANLFNLTTPTYGWIGITGDVNRVVAAGGVSALVDPNDPSKGLKTAQVNGIYSTSPDLALFGAGDRRFGGVEKSTQRRTNLILVETSGVGCRATVRLTDSAGAPLAESDVNLAGNQYYQITDVMGSFGLGEGPYQNIAVRTQVVEGTCRLAALATVIDNQSRNPQIFLLKEPGPPEGSTIGF